MDNHVDGITILGVSFITVVILAVGIGSVFHDRATTHAQALESPSTRAATVAQDTRAEESHFVAAN